MNKIATVLSLFLHLSISCSLYAEERFSSTTQTDTTSKKTSYWAHHLASSLVFNQYSYSNWAAGGNNSIAGTAIIDAKIDYKKSSLSFLNSLSLGYGRILLANLEAPWRKTEDKLNVYSQLNYKLNKIISYSMLLDFKSQFDNGYAYPNDSIPISNCFSPAYITISWGVELTPANPLTIFISPLSGKFTFVLNDRLSNLGAFGVTPASYDENGVVITPGKIFKSEVGFNLVIKYNQTIVKNIAAYSKFELHNNYFGETTASLWNFDIDWEAKIVFSITKFFTTNLFWRMIYDDDVKFPVYETINNMQVKVKEVAKLQFQENFGLGFTYKF